MPLQHLLIIYLIGTLYVFLPSFGLAKLFVKAGVPAWKAYVPFYNTWIIQEINKRPKHWVFWQFIPVVGWFISPGIFIEFAKVFGRFSLGEHTLASLFPFFYFPWLANKKDLRFIGPEKVKEHKKGWLREWVDAAIFAIVAVTLIRTGSMSRRKWSAGFLRQPVRAAGSARCARRSDRSRSPHSRSTRMPAAGAIRVGRSLRFTSGCTRRPTGS